MKITRPSWQSLRRAPGYTVWPGSILAGGGIGALLVAFGNWAASHGADAGDLISAIGSLIGTGLAVMGALTVENYKRGRTSKDYKQRQIGALAWYVSCLEEKVIDRGDIIGLSLTIAQAEMMMIDTLAQAPHDDPRVSAFLAGHKYWVDQNRETLQRICSDAKEGKIAHEVLLAELKEFAEREREFAHAILKIMAEEIRDRSRG